MERMVSPPRIPQGNKVSSGNTASPIPQEGRFMGGRGNEVQGENVYFAPGSQVGDVFFSGGTVLKQAGVGIVLGNAGKPSGISGQASLHFSGFFQTGVKKKVQSLIRQRELQGLQPIIKNINALEPSVQALSDAQLVQKTSEFKAKLSEKLGKPLDAIDFVKDATAVQAALNDILPEAFAVVREASVRVMKMRPFDVQMMAGVALHQNKVIEMKTGEGKTLTSVMPIYLNALLGKGVHVVTANDYLAKRDAEEMGQVFNFLGLSVGVTLAQQPKEEKRKAYQADITYGTNSEFGFDYLRDHLTARTSEEKAQRGFFFAIVDEADSILIDEARTPLIISGSSQVSNDDIGMYQKFAKVVAELVKDRDYELDEKKKLVKLTEEGIDRAELMMGEKLGEPTSGTLFALNQSLRAKEFYHLNIDYLIQNGEVMIVDEFTGRVSQGRRWSEGLHLAIECKEQLAGHPVKIQGEHETDASVTYQNFFRLYPKLAGMTGTAITEADEFLEVYGLPALDIPTNKPYIQKREPDVFTNSLEKKFKAVAEDIAQVHLTKRPILVGTGSIEDSETLSQLLTEKGIPHNVLNAKHHEKEALFVAQAGRLGAVTIATNMAGRGTDIKLGGNPQALKKIIEQQVQELEAQKAKIEETEKNIETLSQSLDSRAKEITEEFNGITLLNTDKAVYDNFLKLAKQQANLELVSEKSELEDRRRLYAKAEAKLKADQATLTADVSALEDEKKQVTALGGLYVIGTERYDSRRVDNQLAGRCARQGDPGTVRFYLSTKDDLFRVNAEPETVNRLDNQLQVLEETKADEGGGWLSRFIANRLPKRLANNVNTFQQDVEARNFESRKHLLQYDVTLDKFRREAYESRDKLLDSQDPVVFKNYLNAMILPAAEQVVTDLIPMITRLRKLSKEQFDDLSNKLQSGETIQEEMLSQAKAIKSLFILNQVTGIPLDTFMKADIDHPQTVAQSLTDTLTQDLTTLFDKFSPQAGTALFKQILVQNLDKSWKTFLNAVVKLRETIQLEAYSEKNPLIAYQSKVPVMYKDVKRQEAWDSIAELMPLVQRLKDEPKLSALVELSLRVPEIYAKRPSLGQFLVDLREMPLPSLDGNPLLGPVYTGYLELANEILGDEELSAIFGPVAQKVKEAVLPFVEEEASEKAITETVGPAPQTTDAPATDASSISVPVPQAAEAKLPEEKKPQ